MKAKVLFFCKPAKKTKDYEVESIFMMVDLPFVPSVGTMLKLSPGGNYIEVSDVMLDITPDGEGLIVGLKEPGDEDAYQLRSWAEMKAQGWQIE